ncbi:MAG: hypothetical protein NW224_19290 [Leptolyngbyaceae cyanobacterium bins.302]|nr:hypothetical protein [Leptolyngbyaceae cyanobacterium bins.302]
MKVRVTEQGLLIPTELLDGFQEFEVQKENHQIVLTPTEEADPIWQLGSNPISLRITDASENHDGLLLQDEFEAIADQLADEFAMYAGASLSVVSDDAISRAGIYEDHP